MFMRASVDALRRRPGRRPIVSALVAGLGLIAVMRVSAVSGRQAAAVLMRVAHPNGPTHHMGRTLAQFAEDVTARTRGAVLVQQQSEFGQPAIALDAVQTGKIEAAGIGSFYWSGSAIQGLASPIAEMDVTLVPYLLVDNDKVRRFPRSEAARLIASKVAANGVHPLMWVFITNTALFSSVARPIVNPEDFKGLRMRSLQGLNQDMFRLLGAEPTPMPPREVTQWIRDGKGDGATTDVVAGAGGRWSEAQKYGTVAPVYSVYYMIFVNDAWWQALAPAHRQAIELAAQVAEQADFDLAAKASAEAVETLRASGMTIHVQTASERTAWEKALVGPLTTQFAKRSADAARVLALVKGL